MTTLAAPAIQIVRTWARYACTAPCTTSNCSRAQSIELRRETDMSQRAVPGRKKM